MWYAPDDDETEAAVRVLEAKETWEKPEVFVSGAPRMVLVEPSNSQKEMALYRHKYLRYVRAQNKFNVVLIGISLLPITIHVFTMIGLAGIATNIAQYHPRWSINHAYKHIMTSRIPLLERRKWWQKQRACTPEENKDATIIEKVLSRHIDDIWDGGQICTRAILLDANTIHKKVIADLSPYRQRAYGGFTHIIDLLAQHYKEEVGSVLCSVVCCDVSNVHATGVYFGRLCREACTPPAN